MTAILRGLGSLPPEERRTVGAAANQAKSRLEKALAQRRGELRDAQQTSGAEAEQIDVTLPGWPAPLGRLHPVTQTLREIEEAFVSMGFRGEEGPDRFDEHGRGCHGAGSDEIDAASR